MIGDGCQEKPPETSQDCGLGKSSDEAKWGCGAGANGTELHHDSVYL